MSAFMVMNEHINAIMSFVVAHRSTRDHLCAVSNGQVALFDATRVGRFLLKENARSVEQLYGDGYPEGHTQTRTYVFRPWRRAPSPVEVIKACQCLEYQSCEHEGHASSIGKKMLREIMNAAIAALPGYEAAPWAIGSRPIESAA
jgi:hypothetical protein